MTAASPVAGTQRAPQDGTSLADALAPAEQTIITVDLPRPRDLTHPKVAQLFHEIEALLEPDVVRSEQLMAAQ